MMFNDKYFNGNTVPTLDPRLQFLKKKNTKSSRFIHPRASTDNFTIHRKRIYFKISSKNKNSRYNRSELQSKMECHR